MVDGPHELSARFLGVLPRRRPDPPGPAAGLAEEGRSSAAPGHGRDGLPAARVLGPEGLAWLLQLKAEWAQLRWLTGAGPPTPTARPLWQRPVEAYVYGNETQLANSRPRLPSMLRP